MARIRTIKPDFFKHADLYDAEIASGFPLRVAFAGLWTVCDREGRFKWRPRELKIGVLPHDQVDFGAVLDVLAEGGFVVRYEVDGETFGYVPSWAVHQAIPTREAKSQLPDPAVHVHAHAKSKRPETGAHEPHIYSEHVNARAETVHAHAEAREEQGQTLNPLTSDQKLPITGANTAAHVQAREFHVHAQGEGKGREGKGILTTTTLLGADDSAPKSDPEPKAVVVEKVKVEGGGEQNAQAANNSQEVVEPIRSPEALVDFENGNPKSWPDATARKVARSLADKLWSYLDADTARQTYRTSGAIDDVKLVHRWMTETGFTVGEIRAATIHAGATTPGTITNPVSWMSKVVPNLILRKRSTGHYEKPGDGPAAPAGAGRPTPRGAPRTDNDDVDAIHRHNDAEREYAIRYLPTWIKSGRKRWPLQAGTAPGTGGSHITPGMLEDAEIQLGVRTD